MLKTIAFTLYNAFHWCFFINNLSISLVLLLCWFIVITFNWIFENLSAQLRRTVVTSFRIDEKSKSFPNVEHVKCQTQGVTGKIHLELKHWQHHYPSMHWTLDMGVKYKFSSPVPSWQRLIIVNSLIVKNLTYSSMLADPLIQGVPVQSAHLKNTDKTRYSVWFSPKYNQQSVFEVEK